MNYCWLKVFVLLIHVLIVISVQHFVSSQLTLSHQINTTESLCNGFLCSDLCLVDLTSCNGIDKAHAGADSPDTKNSCNCLHSNLWTLIQNTKPFYDDDCPDSNTKPEIPCLDYGLFYDAYYKIYWKVPKDGCSTRFFRLLSNAKCIRSTWAKITNHVSSRVNRGSKDGCFEEIAMIPKGTFKALVRPGRSSIKELLTAYANHPQKCFASETGPQKSDEASSSFRLLTDWYHPSLASSSHLYRLASSSHDYPKIWTKDDTIG
jgi:hypothetical protein